MADESKEVVIKISGDPEKFFEAMGLTKKSAENLEANLKTVAKTSAAAFAAFTGEILFSAHAFEESDKAARALTQSLQNQGIYSDDLADSYKQQAADLQKLTGIDDDAIISSQALLQSHLGQTKITKELTKSILDLAEGNKVDLEQAFRAVGKAVEGQSGALKKLGVQVDDNASKQEILAKVVETVNGKFKDQATAANQGLGGLRGLKSAFSDLQEEIGANFAPLLSDAIKLITSFLQTVKENKALLSFIAGAVAAGAAIAGVIAAISSGILAFGALATALGTTSAALLPLLGPIGLVAAALIGVVGAIAAMSAKADESKTPLAGMRKEIQDSIVHLSDLTDTLERYKKAGVSATDLKVQEELINKEKAKLAELEESYKKLLLAKRSSSGQDPEAAAAAKKRQAEEKAAFDRRHELLVAQNELAKLESARASKDLIDLKKKEVETLTKIEDEKFKSSRAALRENLAEIRKLEAEAVADNKIRQETFNGEILKNERSYQGLSIEQKVAFLRKNEQELVASLDTQRTAQEKAVKEELQRDITRQNQLLKNKEKFGDLLGTVESSVGLNIFLDVGKGAQGAADAIAKISSTIVDTIVPGLGSFVSGVLQFLAQGPDKVKEMVSQFIAAIPKVISNILTSIPAIFQGIQAGLFEIVAGIGDMLPAFVTTMIDGAFSFVETIVAKLPEIAVGLLNGVLAAVSALVEKAPEIISKLVTEAPKLISAFAANAGAFIHALVEKVPELFASIREQIPALLGSITQIMRSLTQEIGKAVFLIVRDTITQLFNELLHLPEKIFEGIKDFFKDPLKTIRSLFGFAEGGIVPGAGAPDTVPIMASPGELLVPPQNFDEVVNAVAASRGAPGPAGASGSLNGRILVETKIGFDGREASQVLTARQNEDRALGISREASFAT